MARYPKRQKVKRYRRSFYTREMRLKKGIGIAGSGLGGRTPCAGLGHPHLVYRGAGS